MTETSGEPRGDGGSRAQHVAVGVLAGVLLALGVFTLWHFLAALAWAGIFAIVLWPLYRSAAERLGGWSGVLLPAVFTAGVALVFVLPVGLVGAQLAREAHAATEWLRGAQQNGILEPAVLHQLPFGRAAVDTWWQENLADPGSAADLLHRITQGHVADAGRIIGGRLAQGLTQFVFTLLALFFLLKNGAALAIQLRRAAARAFGPHGERIGLQIIASIHGTVNGLVLVGLGEGLVLGVVYAVAGVAHPTVFGALTAVAAMIPFGAPVVFGAAALLLAAQGSVAGALVVLGAGMVVTFIADHFIRPVLIGGATKLPFIWVLLGILGGIEVWGLVGLFLGPAIMAALILLWREWVSEQTG
jgi:predicted PurR-regulated permease PerM